MKLRFCLSIGLTVARLATAGEGYCSQGLERAKFRHRGHAALSVVLLGFVCISENSALGQYTGLQLPKGYVQLEGDIITTESDAAALRAELRSPRPSFVYAPARLWPNRIVPFNFDAGVTPAQQTTFQTAMASWANSFPGAITIVFQARDREAGFLHFVVADPGFVGGSSSYVGYSGGQVTITVHPQAVATFLIAHEIGHALGLWHEQSRNDRDSYITVITNNILSGYGDQFDKKPSQSTFGDYDYDSVMHYFACAFSKCDGQSGHAYCACTDSACRTIEVVAQYSAQQCNIGQQDHLSDMDRRAMAFMYGPPDWKFLYSNTGSSENGSFQQPFTSLSQAVAGVPANSTLWLGPGTYAATGMTISTPMTLKAAIPDLQRQPNGSLGPSPSGWATLR